MREKNWKPWEFGRMTLNDLRCLLNEDAPSEPGGGGGKARTFEENQVAVQRILEEKNSWPSP